MLFLTVHGSTYYQLILGRFFDRLDGGGFTWSEQLPSPLHLTKDDAVSNMC
jgi:hypothetical protein